jgi:hypothetical protein
MSGIAIFAFAYNSEGEVYLPPQVLKYVDHTSPVQVADFGYINGGVCYLLDTTHNNVTVYPAESVQVPEGQVHVPAPFASWDVYPSMYKDPVPYYSPVHEFAKGDNGWVHLNFGVGVMKPRPHIPIHFQGYDVRHAEQWIPIMMAQFRPRPPFAVLADQPELTKV